MASVYDEVTRRICEELEKGNVPWKKPWACRELSSRNLVTLKEYRGINQILTGMLGFQSPYFLTEKQAEVFNYKVKPEERVRYCPIVFFSMLNNKDGKTTSSGELKKSPMLRFYKVWNISQFDGVKHSEELIYPKQKELMPFEEIESCNQVIRGYTNRPQVKFGMSHCFYSPKADFIGMVNKTNFTSPPEYYSTVFHELIHSTGHENRLNRKEMAKINMFGDHNYSKEELIAEIGSAFLCAHTGISNRVIENQAAYCKAWIKRLKGDKTLIYKAAQGAQRAVDHILGIKYGE